jgi:hypothetical protein
VWPSKWSQIIPNRMQNDWADWNYINNESHFVAASNCPTRLQRPTKTSSDRKNLRLKNHNHM